MFRWGHAIDELSRPIDAIRHQAKTVTVGTSRKEQPLQGIIFDLLKELCFSDSPDEQKHPQPSAECSRPSPAIKGYTLYGIGNLDAEGNATEEPNDCHCDPGRRVPPDDVADGKIGRLMGTKKTIVSTGHLYIGNGKSDGAPIVIIPLLGEGAGSVISF